MTSEIDIDQFSYEELIDLNHRIVERLKGIDAVGDLMQVLDFNVGESVHFPDKHGRAISGMVSKLNKKTVSVTTKEGRRWNVSPRLLNIEKVNEERLKDAQEVIDIRDYTA